MDFSIKLKKDKVGLGMEFSIEKGGTRFNFKACLFLALVRSGDGAWMTIVNREEMM